MNWSDLNPAKLVHHLERGAAFLLAPRRYLRSLETDQPREIAARVSTLALAFGALELLLFARSLEPTQVLLVGLLETILGVAVVPVFYLVIRTLGGRAPWRVALVYVLTMRFTFMVPALLFYAIFLVTEDYAFAVFRGVAVAAYLVLLFTILPFAYFDRLRVRLAALTIGLLAFGAYVWLISIVFEHSTTDGSKLARLSLLYDPIGAELEKSLPERFDKSLGLAQPAEFRAVVNLASSGKSDSTKTYVIYRADSMSALAMRWVQSRGEFRRSESVRSAQLNTRLDSAQFETTKQFLGMHTRRITIMQEIAARLDTYAAAPRASVLLEFYDPYIELLKIENQMFEMTVANSRVRRRLMDYGLLDPLD